MFRSVFWFELKLRLRSKATWIVFLVILTACWRDMMSGFWDQLMGSGRVARNSPFAAYYLLMLSVFWAILLGAGLMTAPFLRDMRLRVAPLIYAAPVPDRTYFLGKFFAGLLGVLLPMLGTSIGFVTLPWVAAFLGKPAADYLLPPPYLHFAHAWLIFALPGILLQGALQTFLAIRTGRVAAAIGAAVMWMLVWILIDVATKDSSAPYWLQVFDPLGKSTLEGQINYWSADERMSRFLSLSGAVFWNKLLWVGLSGGLFLASLWRFDLRALLVREWRRDAKRKEKVKSRPPQPLCLSAAKTNASSLPARQTILDWLRFALCRGWQEFRLCTGATAFRVLMAWCLLAATLAATRTGALFPQPDGRLLPATFDIYTLAANSYFTGLIITLLYYAGEIVSRERSSRLHLIVDAAPVPDWALLLAKGSGIVLLTACVAAIPLGGTLVAALLGGWVDGGWPLLALRILLDLFCPALAYAAAATACHLAIPHRGIAHGAGIFLFLSVVIGHEIEVLESRFWQFGFPLLTFRSDWDIHAASLEKLLWLDAWWLSLGAVLLAVALLFRARGVLHTGLREACGRLRGAMLLVLPVLTLLAAFIGSGLWHRLVVLGDYQSRAMENTEAAEYEKTFASIRDLPQPKITHAELHLDLHPAARRADYGGNFQLENKHPMPVTELHLEHASFTTLGELTWNGQKLTPQPPGARLRHLVLPLPKPLAPGEKAALTFTASTHYPHFTNEELHGKIFADGSLFEHKLWPRLGYQRDRELTPSADRTKHGLGPRRGLPEPGSEVRDLALTDDADFLTYRLRVSTDAGQQINAPGRLIAEKLENSRHEFHFESAGPSLWNLPVTSGGYRTHESSSDGVRIIVQHHPRHGINAPRFAEAAQQALTRLSALFGPCPWQELRIVETPLLPEPHNKEFQPTAAGNVILIPEKRGWLHDYRPGDAGLDYIRYIVTREIARGWLDHRVPAANAKGAILLSDSLPGWFGLSALTDEDQQQYTASITDRYLRESALEDTQEPPLLAAEDRDYLAAKGALAFHALQQALGGEKMHALLRQHLPTSPFARPAPLIEALITAAPPEKQPALRDFFEKVIPLEIVKPQKKTPAE